MPATASSEPSHCPFRKCSVKPLLPAIWRPLRCWSFWKACCPSITPWCWACWSIGLRHALRAKALLLRADRRPVLRLAASPPPPRHLIRWSILELLGAAYLLLGRRFGISLPNRVRLRQSPGQVTTDARLWPTIIAIELTDLAFAVDSILAAVALVGPAPASASAAVHPKFWVIAIGGMLGVILMRFAAAAWPASWTTSRECSAARIC